MVYFDGAKLCKIIGIYTSTKLQSVLQKDSVVLYRDDGLGVTEELPGPETERKRTQIVEIFKKLETINCDQNEFTCSRFFRYPV